jgi:CRISPR system Cascade subunit CasC
VFGKMDTKDPKNPDKKDLLLAQIAHFSPEEEAAIFALADRLAAENREPEDEERKLLRKEHSAADIALFGRMLAEDPAFNTEAAAQVAHALTVHETAVEDDFFTAVDDLNEHQDDAGSGFLGELEFGAGLFYLYLCIDRGLLVDNLGGDAALARRTLQALTEAAAQVAPTGKQNSFASRARASYILAERGPQQPRSLSVAFLDPVTIDGEGGFLNKAVAQLEEHREGFERAYGSGADAVCRVSAAPDPGQATASFNDLLAFVAEGLPTPEAG